mmetsp:Transcript_22178/g.42304  ORF Transcript_22178/g.42304 Transcript_22178/m.42304 type:complete len:177 (-) Transcript_22178:1501-2031(-)
MGVGRFTFETHPNRVLELVLFSNVSNARDLHQKMLAGVLGFEAAFINASLMPDVVPVLASANKALIAESRGMMTTKNLHSELVYNLSGSKHITQSLQRWGISQNSSSLLVGCFDADADQLKAVRGSVEGKEMALDTLSEVVDAGLVLKSYKIPETELQVGSISDAILTRIALRDCT